MAARDAGGPHASVIEPIPVFYILASVPRTEDRRGIPPRASGIWPAERPSPHPLSAGRRLRFHLLTMPRESLPPPPACGSRVHAQAPSRLLGGRSETCAGGALRAVPHPLSLVGHDMGRDRPSSGPRGVSLCLVVGIHVPTPPSPPIPRSPPNSTRSRNPGNCGPFDRTCNSWQTPDAPKDHGRHTPRFQTPGRPGSDGQNGIPPLGFSGPMGIPPLESPGDRPDRFRPHDMEMDYVAERPLYGQMALGRPTTLPLHALATVALGGRGVLLVHPRPYRQP